MLEQDKYHALYGQLSNWRNNMQGLERENKRGILPFVSGLRFSANILYIVRKILKGSKLDAVWGHIIDDDNEYNIYSNESDIIIHRNIPEWEAARWNGDNNYKIMDFHFVRKAAVVGVISCKSLVRTIDNELKLYPIQLSGSTNTVWLFAECCSGKKEGRLLEKAKAAGYKDFWTLYNWDEVSLGKVNEISLLRFENKIRSLARRYP